LIELYTQATSKCRIELELEAPLGNASIEDNSYSGEYVSAFSINTIRVALLVKSITMYKALLNQPLWDV
jgi:hypothetical protein